jgi:hypothetical protein
MTSEQLNARIAQAKRSAVAEAEAKQKEWLTERYGTDDQEEIAKWHAEKAKLSEEAEKRKRDEMTEVERHRADLARSEQATLEWKQKYQQARRAAAYERQNSTIKTIASAHVDPRYVESAVVMLARHVKMLSPDKKKSFGKPEVTKWFTEFVKEQPAFGKEQPKPREVKQEPVTTGASPAETAAQPKPIASAVAAGKTLSPGKPNSMSPEEVTKWKQSKGYSW